MNTPDGERLHAYLMLQDSPRDKKTMFMCHANAGNMGHRVPIAVRFFRSGWNVFIFSYRGYSSLISETQKGTENQLDRQRRRD
jgi:predicted alpha/beta hydrolase